MRSAVVIVAAVLCAVVGTVATSCADDGGAAPPTSTATSSTSTSTTSTSTTSSTSTSTSTSTTSTSTSTTSTSTTSAVDVAPGPVEGLTARTGGGSGEVVLTWQQNPEADVVRYVVLRADTAGGPTVVVGNVTRAQVDDFVRFAPFVDVPVRVGYYRVSAVDGAGNVGPRSAEVCGASPGNRC